MTDDAFETLLQHDEQAPIDGGRSAAAAFFLSVEEGPDRGLSLLVDPSSIGSRVYIGTSKSSDLCLTDRAVSRRHVALEISGQHLRVTDLGSTNGTTADGVRVVEVLLSGGELLRLGSSTALTVERRSALHGRSDDGAPVSTPSEPPTVIKEDRFGRLVGGSQAMRRLHPLLERLATSTVPVILEGETGTGKEVLAEAIHEMGPRASRPFVVFDCTTVAPSLVESELFGHERGAFTGAVSTRKGVFEQADGGTLLIDEIGDLDLALQPKLLRVLERSEVRRVGGDNRPIKVDVRVLFATRRDLEKLIEQGLFRDDLFHRMSVARIELPPLRKRADDIARLVQHFARAASGGKKTPLIPSAVMARWQNDPWPGNVRALRNAVVRWLALGDLAESQEQAAATSTSAPAAATTPSSGEDFMAAVLEERLPLAAAREKIVLELERRYIERVLADHGGSVARAAEASGIARRHFQRLKAKSARD